MPPQPDDVVKTVAAAGGKAIAVQADVAKEADILRLFQEADKAGQLAVLINNAGVVDRSQRIDEMTARSAHPHDERSTSWDPSFAPAKL